MNVAKHAYLKAGSRATVHPTYWDTSRTNQNIYFFIFGRGSKKIYGGVGGVSGYDMWKYAQNHWIFTPQII